MNNLRSDFAEIGVYDATSFSFLKNRLKFATKCLSLKKVDSLNSKQ